MNDAREAAAAEYPEYCAGWFLAMSALGPDAKPGEAPWPYSCEPDDAQPADESYCEELKAEGFA